MPKSASTVAPSRPQPLFGEKDAPTLDGVDCDAMPLPEDLEPHGEGQRSLVADVSKAKGWSLRANALWQVQAPTGLSTDPVIQATARRAAACSLQLVACRLSRVACSV